MYLYGAGEGSGHSHFLKSPVLIKDSQNKIVEDKGIANIFILQLIL